VTCAYRATSGWHPFIPEDLEGVIHALGDAVASGSGYNTEYRTLTATGDIRWLAGRGQVLLGARLRLACARYH